MQTIRMNWEGLSRRENQIRSILGLLAMDPGGTAWARVSMQAGVLVFAMYDGTRPPGPVTDWRFSTGVSGIRASYYERWNPVPGEPALMYLDRAYFAMYQREGPVDEIELLALHCDPAEPEGEGAVYKRGPHLHVVAAKHPIPRAHIALAVGHLQEVLAGAHSLTQALRQSILMIRDEVLIRIKRE